ncbi:MAG: SRPBCC domain-containing protein, partial [Marmoricola sp.]
FRARFTSGWEGSGRVEVCEAPRRLVVWTTEEGASQEHAIEATLTPEGDRTLLVIEERGLPAGELPAYGAGWQVHLEDLGASLAGRDRCDMGARWGELFPAYQELAQA